MSDHVKFQQINIVAGDWEATLAFYRRLGLDIADPPGPYPPGSEAFHTETAQVEFDNEPMARVWHAGWRAGDQPSRIVVTYSVASREAVDDIYGALTGAGHAGRQPPFDTFWGARYAIVQDPNGIDVGIMSPSDPTRRYVPDASGSP